LNHNNGFHHEPLSLLSSDVLVSFKVEPIEAQSGTIELYVEHPEPSVINATTIKILFWILQAKNLPKSLNSLYYAPFYIFTP